MVWGFYYSFIGSKASFYSSSLPVAVHIVSLLLWCVLFGFQVYYAATGKIDRHRASGKFSYILVPVILISTFIAANQGYAHSLSYLSKPMAVKTVFHNYIGALTFLLFYTMAMLNRHKRPLHLRYMIATTPTFLGAAVYRINYIFIGIPFLGMLHYGSLMCTFITIDTVYIGFIIWDKLHGKSYRAYWLALIVCVTEQVLYFSFTDSAAWMWVVNQFP